MGLMVGAPERSPVGLLEPSAVGRRGVFVDPAERHLRSIYEYEEELQPEPTRSMLARRLGISRSAVGQRIDQLIGDGLVELTAGRRVGLTDAGRSVAIAVTRKHRLVERLLVDVVGLEWEFCHAEASRWQHVIGEIVERKLIALLDDPRFSPFGDPIPGLGELCPSFHQQLGPDHSQSPASYVRLDRLATRVRVAAVVRRIHERLQDNWQILVQLRTAGVTPGSQVMVQYCDSGCAVRVSGATGLVVLDAALASAVLAEPLV